MHNIKIALHQFNPIIGDINNNINIIKDAVIEAKNRGCNLFITSELAITGYPPSDLLLRDDFYHATTDALKQLLVIHGITIVCGVHFQLANENAIIDDSISSGYTQNQIDHTRKTFNSAVIIRDGCITARYDKLFLPNYNVFDECRYFYPGVKELVFDCNGIKVGIVICEDMWLATPITMSARSGAEIICVLNASPYDINKYDSRIETAKKRVAETTIPLIYVNQVGGYDDLVFDGASFALDNLGNIALQMPAFVAQTSDVEYMNLVVDSCLRRNDSSIRNDNSSTNDKVYSNNNDTVNNKIIPYPEAIESVYQALVLAIKDYVNKNGFKGVILGLSGGIDSALTLAIAYDALGRERVTAVMMPSIYTADISNIDAKEMIDILQIKSTVVPIENLIATFKEELTAPFMELGDTLGNKMPNDTTFENLQARSRGTILMAISNRLGYLLLTTGNKSEIATGYATLYGDMAGGFALLKDVSKTLVYALSRYRNTQSYIIPDRIITRAPSAELRENQTDQDSLPEYDVLDQIIEMLVEKNLSTNDIVLQGFDKNIVTKIALLLKNSEHKRSQAAIGPRITTRSFGPDWRIPITNKFKF